MNTTIQWKKNFKTSASTYVWTRRQKQNITSISQSKSPAGESIENNFHKVPYTTLQKSVSYDLPTVWISVGRHRHFSLIIIHSVNMD